MIAMRIPTINFFMSVLLSVYMDKLVCVCVCVCVCVFTLRRAAAHRTVNPHTAGSKITLPNTDQAHDKHQ